MPDREPRVVRQHGVDAHEHGVRPAAHQVYPFPRGLPGDPLGMAVPRGDAAVQRLGQLEQHEGPAGCPVVDVGGVQLPRFRFEEARLHGDALRAQPFDSLARNAPVRIGHGDVDAGDARRDDRVRARRRAAPVAAGLQGYVQLGPPRAVAGLLERLRLGVPPAVFPVVSPAHDHAVADDHGAHHGIGTGPASSPRRQVQRLAHEYRAVFGFRHGVS